ncbi:membrane protein [Philodulcilactobacillus myokoensis]|uniref:Membrane protein n=1 Tax=Philodulcilactobacillus myokoensis TaxID=2929573 RepID=A0A9W6ESF2_9LACO|nr:DUF975 family protein [Philodulcilactobacillus myokoensis]GLB46432.1 membrane protein [Philodulcilactobacillus myokoensis]
MNRRQLKEEAKSVLNGHFKFFALLFLPIVILNIIVNIMSNSQSAQQFQQSMTNLQNIYKGASDVSSTTPTPSLSFNFGILIISIVAGLLACGVLLVTLNSIRGQNNYKEPFVKSTFIISKARYFWGSILIFLAKFVLLFLWGIIFTIIGVAVAFLPINPSDKVSIDIVVFFAGLIVMFIKNLSYSQAFFIYYDSIINNDRVGYFESITKSRELLKGHLGEYFVLQLSFIGWLILAHITLGIALIWIYPYYDLTMSNYYDHLLNLNQ